MTYGYIEDLKFAIEVFDQGGNLKEASQFVVKNRLGPAATRSSV